jgi:hypothetical protein
MTVAPTKTYSAQLLSLSVHHRCSVCLRTIVIFCPPIAQLNTFVFAHQISQNRYDNSPQKGCSSACGRLSRAQNPARSGAGMRSALRLIRLPWRTPAPRALWRARHGGVANSCNITRRRAVRGFRKYFRNPIISKICSSNPDRLQSPRPRSQRARAWPVARKTPPRFRPQSC